MTDGRYFQPAKRGELHELKEELHTTNKEKKKEAVKKVIAAMTVGKDVSSLFPDVVNCMQTTNIELKKLVYLYVINYAKAQPELAILAVNTFRKDSLDPSPLIRALAMRTMGCIRLEDIAEYLVEPLQRGCRDPDPYVRKTAAIGITKLFDIRADMVEEEGFIEELKTMLGDSNAVVVANAVAALAEISEKSKKNFLSDILSQNETNINKLLTALNECTEWGQVFILDALTTYEPPTPRLAESVIDRVMPRLSHANSAVVLSAIKVIMKLLDRVTNQDVIRAAQRKLSPPLVTLLSAEPEIQYVALRNIDLIVQKRPSILANEIKVFFCKYNDPVYVKLEKLEVLVRLASEKNVDQVVSELREYATEVDVDFVRKAIRCVGRCALKIETAAGRCLSVLLNLIQTKVNYVVQEAVVVVRDIFRKYPRHFDGLIPRLCDDLDALYEPAAKASMVWILGEYVDCIPNAEKLLEMFLETFIEEPAMVQLQLLTAAVKIYLKRPANTKKLVTGVLEKATEEGFNADLRDRAYIYWRMLSRDPEASKKVILAPKPPINDDADALDYKTLDILIGNIGMLASVYHKLPESFAAAAAAPPPAAAAGRVASAAAADGAAAGGGSSYSKGAAAAARKKKEGAEEAAAADGGARRARKGQEEEQQQQQREEEEREGKRANGSSSSSRHRRQPLEASSSEEEQRERRKKGNRRRRHAKRTTSPSASRSSSSEEEEEEEASSSSSRRRSSEGSSTDLLGLNDDPPTAQAAAVQQRVVLTADQPGVRQQRGLQIEAALERAAGGIQLLLKFTNRSSSNAVFSDWLLQFNRNSFGLAPAAALQLSPLRPGAAATAVLPVLPGLLNSETPPSLPLALQVAVKTNVDEFYFLLPFSFNVVLLDRLSIEKEDFRSKWIQLGEDRQSVLMAAAAAPLSSAALREQLRSGNIFHVAQWTTYTFDTHYLAAKTVNELFLLMELSLQKDGNLVKLVVRSDSAALVPLLTSSVCALLHLTPQTREH